MYKAIRVAVFIMAVLLVMGPGSSYAFFAIQLSDGSTAVTIEDQGVDDSLDNMEGAIGFSNTVGVFDIKTVTGLSYPVVGTSSLPEMFLGGLTVSNSVNGGTLTMMLTQTDLEPIPYSTIQTIAGGTTSGLISINTYFDSTNTPFGTETDIGLIEALGLSGFSGTAESQVGASGPFSLTTVVTITQDSGSEVTSFSSELAVLPEPVSSTLFVIGAAVLGSRTVYRYRKKRKTWKAVL